MALYALLASMAMIVLYVWIRFQNVIFGLAAVLALVHDVLVTIAFLADELLSVALPGVPAGRSVQDQPGGGGGPADDRRLFDQRYDRRLRSHSRSARQEPRFDRADDQSERQSNAEPHAAHLRHGVHRQRHPVLHWRAGHPRLCLLDGDRRDRRHLQLDLHRGSRPVVDEKAVRAEDLANRSIDRARLEAGAARGM